MPVDATAATPLSKLRQPRFERPLGARWQPDPPQFIRTVIKTLAPEVAAVLGESY